MNPRHDVAPRFVTIGSAAGLFTPGQITIWDATGAASFVPRGSAGLLGDVERLLTRFRVGGKLVQELCVELS